MLLFLSLIYGYNPFPIYGVMQKIPLMHLTLQAGNSKLAIAQVSIGAIAQAGIGVYLPGRG